MIDSESLILKYRPQKWKDVIGQNEVVKSLQEVVKKKNSHSFLFTGSSGLGKTTLARITAQELGAINNNDIFEVDASTFTSVDDMRAITVNIKYKPIGKSTIKAIILDEVHSISRQAWQSLLKSIEEPPSHCFWFFCTTDPGKVPDTVRTRCTTYQLKNVSVDDLYDLLVKIANEEDFNVTEEVVDICAKEAHGSPRQAIVNLAICSNIQIRSEAAKLLKSALTEDGEAIELARLLLKNPEDWQQLTGVLNKLKEQNPESIRQVIRGYITTVLLSDKLDPKTINSCLGILDNFSQPMYNVSDGISPIVLACGKYLYLS